MSAVAYSFIKYITIDSTVYLYYTGASSVWTIPWTLGEPTFFNFFLLRGVCVGGGVFMRLHLDLQVHLNKLECRGKVHLFQ